MLLFFAYWHYVDVFSATRKCCASKKWKWKFSFITSNNANHKKIKQLLYKKFTKKTNDSNFWTLLKKIIDLFCLFTIENFVKNSLTKINKRFARMKNHSNKISTIVKNYAFVATTIVNKINVNKIVGSLWSRVFNVDATSVLIDWWWEVVFWFPCSASYLFECSVMSRV